VLSRWPEAEVTFVDVSTDAVEQTRANLIENGLRQETKVIQADLADFLASGQTPQFNLILTNPPYVDPTGEFEESLKWEPAQALFAQDRGLSLIYQILELAPKKLKVGGELVIEFGKGQEKAIEQKLRELDLAHYTFGKDQFGVVRWVRLKWKQ
jgi:release factor glutamine methyltransferase